jgi:hypothetical protein
MAKVIFGNHSSVMFRGRIETAFVNFMVMFSPASSTSEILVGLKAWMLPGPRQKESTILRGSERRKEI